MAQDVVGRRDVEKELGTLNVSKSDWPVNSRVDPFLNVKTTALSAAPLI